MGFLNLREVSGVDKEFHVLLDCAAKVIRFFATRSRCLFDVDKNQHCA
jgi:hypothetical protein